MRKELREFQERKKTIKTVGTTVTKFKPVRHKTRSQRTNLELALVIIYE